MKYIYAALLLHEAGKEINEENLKKIIQQIEEPDEARIKILLESLKGVDIEEILKTPIVVEAKTKEEKEEKKEVKEEVKEEAPAAEGLAALFG